MNSPQVANMVEEVIRAQYQYKEPTEALFQISPEELERIISLCRQGILGPGEAQYANVDGHKFETMPLTDLMVYIEEEARDFINYGAFMLWRVSQINSALTYLASMEITNTMREMALIPPIAPIDSSDLLPSTEQSSDQPPSSTSESTFSKAASLAGMNPSVYPEQPERRFRKR